MRLGLFLGQSACIYFTKVYLEYPSVFQSQSVLLTTSLPCHAWLRDHSAVFGRVYYRSGCLISRLDALRGSVPKLSS